MQAVLWAALAAATVACPLNVEQADPGAEQARQALAAAPLRPGLALAFADRLLASGAVDQAQACAQRVIAAWPDAVRARLMLARVALARGQSERARALLEPIAATGPRVAADEARRLLGPTAAAPPPGRWGGRLALGGYHDSRAAALDPERRGQIVDDDPLPVADDPAAWRLALAGEAAWTRADPDGVVRLRGGLDRTLHIAEAADPGRLDHTSLWLDGHREHRLGADRLGYGGELRGTLAGRLGDPHHLGLGLVGWWRRAGPSGGPWARVRLFGFAFAETDDGASPAELWSEAAVGGTWKAGLFSVDGRLGGQWVGPGDRSYAGIAADVRPGISGALGGVYLLGGFGWRRAVVGDAIAPRVGAGGRLELGGRAALAVDGIWQQARRTDVEGARIDRIVVGSTLEVWF